MKAKTAMIQMTQAGNSAKLIASIFRRLLGCRHSHLSRPFTVNDKPCRTCLKCGARLRFDGDTWTKLHLNYI